MLSLEKEAVHDKLEVDSKFYKVKESEFVQRIQVLNKKLYRISYKCRSELGVVKRDKLDYKITDEEGKIIDIRIKLQQQLHECYNERDLFRKVSRVKKILIDLTDEEIIQGLNEYGKDEELLIEKFTEDSDFLMRIRERIASRKDLRQVESSIDTGQSSQAHNTSNSVKKYAANSYLEIL